MLLPSIGSANEMDDLLAKLNELSKSATCKTNNDCASITLGWADCSINNYEFPISTTNKTILIETIETAKKYENLWYKAVMKNKIPKECKVQKFSESACKSGLCVLLVPQVEPESPPEVVPDLMNKVINQ